MATGGGLTILDGSQLRGAELHPVVPDGAVTGARLLQYADSEAAARLFGIVLPESLRSAARRRMVGDGDRFLEQDFDDADSMKRKVCEYLLALADELADNPLVISALDGSALQVFLEDEDDFAMLAENLFTDLDADDNGKLTKKEIQNALALMGPEMGVPPFSGYSDLLNNILKKHGAEGDEQLGQAQFAQLLQLILQDLADVLAEKPIVVIQNVKVANGSKIKLLLNNEELLDREIESMFEDWNAKKHGGYKDRLQELFKAKRLELGLPPTESNEAAAYLYDQVFSGTGEVDIEDLTRDAFQAIVKDLMKKIVDRLEENPILVEMGS
ncbi:hypothetical protein Cni_G00248 [Canna indica]|uniref:EF-hand domain-containing protein n=1 Tax=Canna indica TaxID=4628 RepID=A0AAQ3JL03_9LILI|nr:hypothetical protein Cni_G00248 [Canna indica]